MHEFESKLEAEAIKGLVGDLAHDLLHLRRVRANALAIAKTEADVDYEVLLAAVWLHDCVHIEKTDPRHSQTSRITAGHVSEVLSQWNIPAEKISRIASAIETHSFSSGLTPASIEGKILRDADRLDALGAIGIARCMYYGSRMGRPIYDIEDPWAEHRPLDDTRFGIDHFYVKLLKLEEGMMTGTGRRMARERTDVMRQFLEHLKSEINA